jgi:hypothetical protein
MTCRRRLAPALALLVAAAVGGCARSAATDTGPAGAASPPAAATATSATEPEAAPAPPDPAAAEQARTRATAFLRAFARTDLDQQAWWNGVADYFTPAAAAIYRSTDVANVPVHTVEEGSARLLPDTTRYRAEVTVGTDIGTYTVVLLRADDDWLVDRAVPPTP